MKRFPLYRSLVFATIFAFGLSACPAPPPPLPQGCFNPVPQQPRALLAARQGQLQWPAAHRGDQSAGPGNSLAAIKSALRRRIPLIEIDVQRTRDGVPFLFHDRRLHSHNFRGPASLIGREVRSLTSFEIHALALPAPSTERLPLLSQAFDALRGHPSSLLLDLKGESEEFADQVVRLATQKKVLRQIIVQCQRPGTAMFLRAHHPEAALLARCHEPSHLDIALKITPAPEIVQIDPEWATPAILSRIHAAGSAVLVKSLEPGQDRPEFWQELMTRGVDIVLTDFPRQFHREILSACGNKP